MNQKEVEQKRITIHWWNFGTKTLDHKGTYKEFLDKKDIAIKPIKNKENWYRIRMSIGTSRFTIENYSTDFIELFNIAIKTFLEYLGDKTLFNDGRGREYKINWR